MKYFLKLFTVALALGTTAMFAQTDSAPTSHVTSTTCAKAKGAVKKAAKQNLKKHGKKHTRKHHKKK